MPASDSCGRETANSQKNLRSHVNAEREPHCLLSAVIAGMARSYRWSSPVSKWRYLTSWAAPTATTTGSTTTTRSTTTAGSTTLAGFIAWFVLRPDQLR